MPKKSAKKIKQAKPLSREEQKKDRMALAKKFSDKIVKKYGSLVKSVVLWGSTARDEFREKSDIDFVILIDDTLKQITPQEREELDYFIYDLAKKMDERISPQPSWTITEFVSMTKAFNPLAYAVLKSSIAIHDNGFFMTHKRLLEMGYIAATPEASMRRWGDVPRRVERAKQQKLYLIIEDLYYAMVGAEEAVMMYMGKHLPHPIHAVTELKKELVEPGFLDPKYLDILDEVVKLRKKVEEREIKDIDSKEIDTYIKKTEEFVGQMENILRELEIIRKRNDIQRAYEAMIRSSVSALKAVKQLPEDPKELPKAFKKHLIDSKRFAPFYYEVLDRILFMKHKMNEKKAEEVTERELTLTTEYVRRFVLEVAKLCKDMGIEQDGSQPLPDVEPENKNRSQEKKTSKKDESRLDLDTVKKEEKKDTIKEHEVV